MHFLLLMHELFSTTGPITILEPQRQEIGTFYVGSSSGRAVGRISKLQKFERVEGVVQTISTVMHCDYYLCREMTLHELFLVFVAFLCKKNIVWQYLEKSMRVSASR